MKFRIVDAAFLLATIAGAVMAVTSARKLHGLQAEYARLTRTAGDLIVTDPAQLHVQALETGEPLHFAWRVYAPTGQTVVSESSGSGGKSSSTDFHSQPREFMARVRFTEHRTGQMAAYRNFGGGSGFWTFGSQEMFQFLREHWDELDIEQLGADETARVKPGEVVTVLRISMPENVAAEARQKLTDPNSRPLIPVVFESRLELRP